jgi:sec-independent protein translocase protein TatB
MFDIGYSELLLIGIVALLVIGPKDLPRVMREVGGWVNKGRSMARHFRSGLDTMMRESELEEMNRKWAEQNRSIMQQSLPEPTGTVAPAAADAAADPPPAPKP